MPAGVHRKCGCLPFFRSPVFLELSASCKTLYKFIDIGVRRLMTSLLGRSVKDFSPLPGVHWILQVRPF